MDLTKTPASYVYYLVRLEPSSEEMFYDTNYDTPKMIHAVSEAVHKANDTQARKRFLRDLNACYTKHEVQALCYNAIERGRNYKGY
jgi:hypothetical protein